MKHLVEAVQSALGQENYYSALVTCLTLPDICGWIEDPASSSRTRFNRFFDRYLRDLYHVQMLGRTMVFLEADDFYALRCAMLHQGVDEIGDQRVRKVLDSFVFVACPPNFHFHRNRGNSKLQLDVRSFCTEITDGVANFVAAIQPGSDSESRLSRLCLIQDGRAGFSF